MDAIDYATKKLTGLLKPFEAEYGDLWTAISISTMEQRHPLTDQSAQVPVALILIWFDLPEGPDSMMTLPPIVTGVESLCGDGPDEIFKQTIEPILNGEGRESE